MAVLCVQFAMAPGKEIQEHKRLLPVRPPLSSGDLTSSINNRNDARANLYSFQKHDLLRTSWTTTSVNPVTNRLCAIWRIASV